MELAKYKACICEGLQHIVSPTPDGKKRRNILILKVRPLRPIRDISSRHHGSVLQIPIRS